jgi:hypothetical protein
LYFGKVCKEGVLLILGVFFGVFVIELKAFFEFFQCKIYTEVKGETKLIQR